MYTTHKNMLQLDPDQTAFIRNISDDLVRTKDLIVAGKHNGLLYILNYFKNLISTFIRPSWQWKNHVIS